MSSSGSKLTRGQRPHCQPGKHGSPGRRPAAPARARPGGAAARRRGRLRRRMRSGARSRGRARSGAAVPGRAAERRPRGRAVARAPAAERSCRLPGRSRQPSPGACRSEPRCSPRRRRRRRSPLSRRRARAPLRAPRAGPSNRPRRAHGDLVDEIGDAARVGIDDQGRVHRAIVAARGLPLPVSAALRVPGLEAPAGRREIGGKLIIERTDLVPQLEELVGRPPLGLADMSRAPPRRPIRRMRRTGDAGVGGANRTSRACSALIGRFRQVQERPAQGVPAAAPPAVASGGRERRDGAELLQHPERVPVRPALGDPAVRRSCRS